MSELKLNNSNFQNEILSSFLKKIFHLKRFITFIIKSIEKYEKNVFVRLNFN